MASPFDSILNEAAKLAPAHKAVVATPSTPCVSAPFSFKASTNAKKGIVTSYLTVYNDPATGMPYVDDYLDIVEPGSFKGTIAALTQQQKDTNNPYLCLYLWQHNKGEVLGGIKALSEDSKGVIYEAQVNLNVQRAREAFSLIEEQQLKSMKSEFPTLPGDSYGGEEEQDITDLLASIQAIMGKRGF